VVVRVQRLPRGRAQAFVPRGIGAAVGTAQDLFDQSEGGFDAAWDAGITYMYRGWSNVVYENP
jgi:hypothetical protein